MSEHHCAHCSRNRHDRYYDCSSENDMRSRDSIRNAHQRSANILQNLGDLREFYKQLQNFADITYDIFKKTSDTQQRNSSSSDSMHRRKDNKSNCCNYNCQCRRKSSTEQRQLPQINNDSTENRSSGSHQEISSERCNTYSTSAAGWLPNITQFPKISKSYSLYMELENTDYTKCQPVTGKLSQKTEHQQSHGFYSSTRGHHDNDTEKDEYLSQGKIKHNNSKRHDTPNQKKKNYGVSNESPISATLDFGDKCENHNYLDSKYDGMCSRAVIPSNHQTKSGCSIVYKNTQTLPQDANVRIEHNRMVNKEVQTHIQYTDLNKENNGMINKEVQTEFFKKSDTHINKNEKTSRSAPNLRASRISSVVLNSKPNVLCTEKLNNKKLELMYFSQISEKFIRPSSLQDSSVLNIKTTSKVDQNKESDYKTEIETEKKIEQAILIGGGIREESSNNEHYQFTNKSEKHYKTENNCSSSHKSNEYEDERKTASSSLFEREYTKKLRDSNQYHVRSQELPSPVVCTFADESKLKLLNQKSTLKSSEDQNTHTINNKSTDQKLKPTYSSKETSKPVETKNEFSEANLISGGRTKKSNHLKNKEESYHKTENIYCFMQNKQQCKAANDTENPISVTGSKRECIDIEQSHIRSQESTEYDSDYICTIGEKSKPKLLNRSSTEEYSEAKNNSNMYKKSTTYKLETTCCSIETINPIETEKKIQAKPRGENSTKEFSNIERNQLRNKDESHHSNKNIHSSIQNNQQHKFAKDATRPVTSVSGSKKEKRKSLVRRSAEEYPEADNNSNIYKNSTNQKPKKTPYSIDTIYSIKTENKIQTKPLGASRTKKFSNINSNQLRNKEKSHHSTKNIHSFIQNNQQHKFSKDATRPVPSTSGSESEFIDIEQSHIESQESTEYVLKSTHRVKEKYRPKPLVRRYAGESSEVESNTIINKFTHQRLKNSHYTIESGKPIKIENDVIQAKLLCVESAKELYNIESNDLIFKKQSHYKTKNIRNCIDKSKHFKIVKDTTKTIPLEREIKKQLLDVEQYHAKSQEAPGCVPKYFHTPVDENKPLDLSQRSIVNRSEIKNVINNTSTDQKRDHICHSIETHKPNETEKKITQAKALGRRSSDVHSSIERTQLRNKEESHHKAENVLSFLQNSQQYKFATDTTRTIPSVSESKKEYIDNEQNDIRSQESSEYVLNHTNRIKKEGRPKLLVRRSAEDYCEAENIPNIDNKSTNQKLKNSRHIMKTTNTMETENKIQAKPLGASRTKEFSNINCNHVKNKKESPQKIENILSFIQNSQQYKFAKDTTRAVPSVSGSKKKCIDIERNHDRSQVLPAFVSKYTSRIKEKVRPKSLVRRNEEKFFEVENNQMINKKWIHDRLKNSNYTMKSKKPIETEIKVIQAKPLGLENAKELHFLENNQLTLTKNSDYNTNNIGNFFNKSKQFEIVNDTLKTIPCERKTTKLVLDTDQCHVRSQEAPGYISKHTCTFVEESIPKPLDLSQRSTVNSSQNDNKNIVNNKMIDQKLENTRYFIETSKQNETKKETIPAKLLVGRCLKELSSIELNHLKNNKESVHSPETTCSSQHNSQLYKYTKDTTRPIPLTIGNKKECINFEKNRNRSQEFLGYVSKYTRWFEEKSMPKSLVGESTKKCSKIKNNNIIYQKSTNQRLENSSYPVEKGQLIKTKKRINQKNFSSTEHNQLQNQEHSLPETENILSSKQKSQQHKFVNDTSRPVSSVIQSKKKWIDINQNYKRNQEFPGYVSKYTRRFEEINRPTVLVCKSAEESGKVENNHNIYQESTDQRLENNSNHLEKSEYIETNEDVIQTNQIHGRSTKDFTSIEHNQLRKIEHSFPKTKNIRISKQNSQQYKFVKDTTRPVPSVIVNKKEWNHIEENNNRSQAFLRCVPKYTRRFQEKNKPKPIIMRSAKESAEVENNHNIGQVVTDQILDNKSYSLEKDKLIETEKVTQTENIDGRSAKEFSSTERNQLNHKEESLFRTENIRSSIQNSQQYKIAEDATIPVSYVSESKNELFDVEQNQNLIKSQELPGEILKYASRFGEESRPAQLIRRVEKSSEIKNNSIISNKFTHQRLENNCCTVEPEQPIETNVRVIPTKEFTSDESYQLRNKEESLYHTENTYSSKQNSQHYKFTEDTKKPAPSVIEIKNEWIYFEGNHDRSHELLKYVPQMLEEKNTPVPLTRRYAKESSKFKNCPVINKELSHQRLQNSRYTIESGQPNEADMKVIQRIPLDVRIIQEFSKNDSYELRNEKQAYNTIESISPFDKSKQYETAKDITKTKLLENGNMRQLLDTEQHRTRSQDPKGHVLSYSRNCVETRKPEPFVSRSAEESSKTEYNQNIYLKSIDDKLENNYPVKTGQPIETEMKTI